MSTLIALLRAINVGGRNRVPMASLRDVVSDEGFTDVTTYIQSGNVVFDGDRNGTDAAAALEAAIVDFFGFEVRVLVRTPEDLADIVAANPYPSPGADPTRVGVVFLAHRPAVEPKVDAAAFSPDEFVLRDREIFLHCPNGFGKTKLTHTFLEKQFQVKATTRNWKTVNKLLELANR